MTDPYDSRPPAADDAPPGLPRWVKVAAIVVGLLILLVIVLQLTGIAGDHGPGMHSSSGQFPVSGTLGMAAG